MLRYFLLSFVVYGSLIIQGFESMKNEHFDTLNQLSATKNLIDILTWTFGAIQNWFDVNKTNWVSPKTE